MANRIDFKHGIRVATALAMVTAMISSSQPSRFGGSSDREYRVGGRLATSSNLPTNLRALTVAARPNGMKAVSSERKLELGRAIEQARCLCDLRAVSHLQLARHPASSGPFRPHNPLRC
jgi:hypothetical protein